MQESIDGSPYLPRPSFLYNEMFDHMTPRIEFEPERTSTPSVRINAISNIQRYTLPRIFLYVRGCTELIRPHVRQTSSGKSGGLSGCRLLCRVHLDLLWEDGPKLVAEVSHVRVCCSCTIFNKYTAYNPECYCHARLQATTVVMSCHCRVHVLKSPPGSTIP
jgi:hypothetical protein